MQSFQTQNKRIEVLHIAAHLGEGVGKAIGGIALCDREYEHEVVLLESPKKMAYVEACRSRGVKVYIEPAPQTFEGLATSADVVVLSWWNHPLAIPVLRKLADLPIRVVLWCHVNGLYYPVLPPNFVSMFDGCMFTSPVTQELPYWTEKDREQFGKVGKIVYGLGNFTPKTQPCKVDYTLNKPLRIGYVGTLDYAKMHPDFMQYCRAVLASGIHAEFIFAGEPSEVLIKDARKLGLEGNVKFLGYRTDIPHLLPEFDIFGYLLNPNNFATTENALLEAMAAGLPVVVSDGSVERAIVNDGVTGLLARNPEDYVGRITALVTDESLRQKLGVRARRTVCAKYSASANLVSFRQAIGNVLQKEKVRHAFHDVIGKTEGESFLVFCPPKAREIFQRAVACQNENEYKYIKDEARTLGEVFKTDKKGAPLQFLKYFPDDYYLQKICGLF